MDKLKKEKKIWLAVFTASTALSAVGIGLTVLFALKLWYVPFGFALAFAIQGFYLAPFSFIAYSNRKRLEVIIPELGGENSDNVQDISKKLSVNPEFISKMLTLARKRGYIKN